MKPANLRQKREGGKSRSVQTLADKVKTNPFHARQHAGVFLCERLIAC
jgi:hypothetical protein